MKYLKKTNKREETSYKPIEKNPHKYDEFYMMILSLEYEPPNTLTITESPEDIPYAGGKLNHNLNKVMAPVITESTATFTLLTVNGLLKKCLMDTGCTFTRIPKELANELGCDIMGETRSVVLDASKQPMRQYGSTWLRFGPKNYESIIRADVGDDIYKGLIILGLDFLRECKIDYKNKHLTWEIRSETLFPSTFVIQTAEMKEVLPHVPADQWERLEPDVAQLVMQNWEIFQEANGVPDSRGPLGDFELIPMEGKSYEQIKPKLYPMTNEKKRIEALKIQQLLKRDWIEECKAKIASPTTLTLKPGATCGPEDPDYWRYCTDYREVNAITAPIVVPTMRIGDILAKLAKASLISEIDLDSAYYQIRIRDDHRWITAFKTGEEKCYQFKVMQFGFQNAPGHFQQFINRVFKDLPDTTAVYLDNIYVFTEGNDRSVHLKALNDAFQAIKRNKLFLKIKKCHFLQKRIKALGYEVGEGCMFKQDKTKEKILSWPAPTNPKQLRGFLGITGWVQKFVKDYGKMAEPLHELLLKDNLTVIKSLWTERHQKAFELLRATAAEELHTQIPNREEQSLIECDASDHYVGAVLKQKDQKSGKWRPCEFFTRKMNPAQQNYTVGEKEMLALVEAVKHWRYYLSPGFIVKTDHKNIEMHIKQQDIQNARILRWVLFLRDWRPDIQYTKGAIHTFADALSRPDGELTEDVNPTECEDEDTSIVTTLLKKEKICYHLYSSLISEIEVVHQRLRDMHEFPTIPNQYMKDNNMYWEEDLLYKRNKIFIPDAERDVIFHIITSIHDGYIHPGINGTIRLVKDYFYWKNIDKDVEEVIKRCDQCQRYKPKNYAAGQLLPMPVPEGKWQIISFDLCKVPPVKSDGKTYDTLMVVVDKFSKMVKLIPLAQSETQTGKVIKAFEKIFSNFGNPRALISDRDVRLTSEEFQKIPISKRY